VKVEQIHVRSRKAARLEIGRELWGNSHELISDEPVRTCYPGYRKVTQSQSISRLVRSL
jgi:hypothetical protein